METKPPNKLTSFLGFRHLVRFGNAYYQAEGPRGSLSVRIGIELRVDFIAFAIGSFEK